MPRLWYFIVMNELEKLPTPPAEEIEQVPLYSPYEHSPEIRNAAFERTAVEFSEFGVIKQTYINHLTKNLSKSDHGVLHKHVPEPLKSALKDRFVRSFMTYRPFIFYALKSGYESGKIKRPD